MMMRYLILLFIFLLVSCVHTKKVRVNNGIQNDVCYKIIKIKSKKPCHTIYAKRNDSIFKIYSTDGDSNNKHMCEKIKVRKCYKLNLVKISPPDSILGLAVHNPLDIGMMVDENGEAVTLEKKSHYVVYGASNLEGLYIHNE